MKQGWHRDLGAIEGHLKPWLEIVDKELAASPSDSALRGKPREKLQIALANASQSNGGKPVKLTELLNSAVFKDRFSASMPNAEDVVLTMFLWHVD